MKKSTKNQEKILEKELEIMEESEYGIKEFIHGMLLGIILGFVLAFIMLK